MSGGSDGARVGGVRNTLITAGRLIDGTGSPLIEDAAVLIRDERIVEAGPARAIRPHEAVERIDLGDCTLLPGLIDAHFHASYCGHMGVRELEWPISLEYAAVCAGVNATTVLEAGYTAALDVGCRGNIAVAVRDAIESGYLRGPRIRASGQVIATRAGPLDVWPSSMRFDPPTRLFAFVSGVEEVRDVVRAQAKAGVDNVKLQITRSTVQGRRRGAPTTFTPEELVTAVQTAHDNGLSTAAHAEEPSAIMAAIEAGFDTIQHASFIDEATIDELERQPSTRIVFTLGVYEGILRRGPELGYPEPAWQAVADAWPHMLDAVRLAAQRGVPFAVGSDAGGRVHPQGRLAREITILVRDVGLPVETAVRAATSSSGQAAWFEDVGTIQPGRLADLIAVRADLAREVDALEDPARLAMVLKGGQFAVDRRKRAPVGALA